MTKLFSIVCAGLLMIGLPATADTAKSPDAIVADYLAAWAQTDATKREAQLAELFVEGGMHQSPNTHSVGRDAIAQEIAAFQQRFPGARVTAENILVTAEHLVFDFALVDANGAAIVSGVDYVKLSGDKIEAVIGFY